MGTRSRHGRPLLRQLSLLLAMPLFITGISYALFSQTLTINSDSQLPQYVSNNYTVWTYTKAATLSGSTYTYRLNPFVITNNGVTSITAWKVMFTVPADTTAITCPTTVTCSINNTTHVVTITRTVTIAAGAASTINNTSNSIRFTTATANYVPQNVDVSATFSTSYVAIPGLTVVVSFGTRVGTSTPINMTITNASGQDISGWQVAVPVNRRCTNVTGLPTGVTYACTTTRLTLTGTAVSIPDGSTYSFTAPLPNAVTSAAYSINGTVTVTGKA